MKRQEGFAHVGLVILLVLVIAGVSFVGWRVYDRNKPKPALSSNSSNAESSANQKKQAQPAETTKPTIPNGYAVYKNTDIGFKFAYPNTWGTIVRTGDDRADLITDGLNGHVLRTQFQNGGTTVFPRGNELNGDTGVGVDEGLYGGGFIQNNGKFYSTAKYTGEQVEIVPDKILAKVTSPIGTVLIIRTGTIAGTEVQLLLNLPEGKLLSGLDMRFITGNYDFAEEGKIDSAGLAILKTIAATFESL